MQFNNYELLPDVLTVEKIKEYFIELIQVYEADEYNSVIEIASAFSELAIRQWHTYEVIEKRTKKRLENVLQDMWDVNNQDLVGEISFIVANLGLKETYEMIKKDLRLNLKPEIRKIIESLIEEIDSNVEDPYSGMQ